MRIRTLEIKNFRQFYGVQRVEFCGATDADPTNVTLIFGENGRGKTGIFRAAMFCLYGDRDLDQDRNYDRESDQFDAKKLYLVNLAAMEEDARGSCSGVECYVRMAFSHGGYLYEMTRFLYGIFDDDGSVIEEARGVKLLRTDSDGNTKPVDQEDIKPEMEQILDARVKDYFLLDGERIERMTKATTVQRRVVANGIKNLLRIDELYKAREAMKLLESDLGKDLQKVSSGDYQKKLKTKDDLVAEDEKLDIQIAGLERELELAEGQLDSLDAELRQFTTVAAQLEQRKQAEEQRKALQAGRENLRARMRAFTEPASVLLANDVLNQVYLDIDEKRKKGEVPPLLRKELIEELFKEMRCICGCDLKEGSEAYFRLKAWENKAPSGQLQQEVMSLFHELGRTSEFVANSAGDLSQLLEEFGALEEQLDLATRRWEDLNKELEVYGDVDLTSKNQARNAVVRKMASLEAEIDGKRKRKDAIATEVEKIERDLVRLEKESREHNQLHQQRGLVVKARTAIAEAIADFENTMRRELEEKATWNFRQLLAADGQINLKAIRVNEDYTLEVLDWSGRPFLANVSAGQRQVVSLAFITALAQVAGGKTVLEVPLFMDTPFGRLSAEHRDKLLSVLPGITPQWILLATETEMGANEQAQLKASKRWGKLYTLETKGEGVTQIVERPLSYFETHGVGVR